MILVDGKNGPEWRCWSSSSTDIEFPSLKLGKADESRAVDNLVKTVVPVPKKPQVGLMRFKHRLERVLRPRRNKFILAG